MSETEGTVAFDRTNSRHLAVLGYAVSRIDEDVDAAKVASQFKLPKEEVLEVMGYARANFARPSKILLRQKNGVCAPIERVRSGRLYEVFEFIEQLQEDDDLGSDELESTPASDEDPDIEVN